MKGYTKKDSKHTWDPFNIWRAGGKKPQAGRSSREISKRQLDSRLTSNLSRLEQAGRTQERFLEKENQIEYPMAVYIGNEDEGNRRKVWASISGEGLEKEAFLFRTEKFSPA